jgi:hypothetical protein
VQDLVHCQEIVCAAGETLVEDSAKTCKIYQIRNTFSVGKIYRESRLSLSELGGNWGNIIMNGIVVKP